MAVVGLYTQEQMTPATGPYKVYANLRDGLTKIGYTVVHNQPGDLTGCLQENPKVYALPPKTLMGPNFFTLPTDRPEFWNAQRNFTVPSDWTRDLYQSFPVTSKATFRVWPVGIDTDLFSVSKDPKYDCLLYLKNRSSEDVAAVQSMLAHKGQVCRTLTYGSYVEAEFLQMLSGCRYAILLTATESQGIAYMEILSANVPCFVLDCKKWRGYPATSVPYFDERCGLISTASACDGRVLNDFGSFLDKLPGYRPREYILENHTLAKSAQRYMNMLEEIG